MAGKRPLISVRLFKDGSTPAALWCCIRQAVDVPAWLYWYWATACSVAESDLLTAFGSWRACSYLLPQVLCTDAAVLRCCLQIHALPDGGTCAEYVLAVQPSIPIPAAAAPYTSGIFKKQVADLLEDLQKELNRQIASGAAPTAK